MSQRVKEEKRRTRENREKRERRKHRKEKKRPTSGIRYVFIFAHLLSLTHYIFIA